jgi:hypothetical protein
LRARSTDNEPGENEPGEEPAEAEGRAHTTATTGSGLLLADRRETEYRIEVLTIRTGGEQETLPVFSSEEEAEITLRFGGVTGGWQARESGAGELVSVLSGPCAGVKKVALDPSPDIVVEGAVGLVSLLRESFIDQIMARRSGPLSLPAPRRPQIRPGHLPFLPWKLRAEDVRDTDKRPLDTELKEPDTNVNNFE